MSDEPSMRERILEEALARFSSRGYAGTSVQSIAEAVGIRKPSLLYHFSSKEELRAAVLGEILERWGEVLPALVATHPGRNRFDVIVGELTRFFVDDPRRAKMLRREFMDRPDEIGEAMRKNVSPWVSMCRSLIETRQAQGMIRPEVDPESFMVLLLHVIVGIASMRELLEVVTEREDDTQQRLIQEATRVLRHSLFVPGEEP